MKGRLLRIEILLYIAIILLFVNIGLSIRNNLTPFPADKKVEGELPEYITSKTLDSIITYISTHFNNEDVDSLYDLFGPYAKTEISIEDFKSQMSKLDFIGKIEKFTYTHFEVLGKKDGGDFINIFYKSRFTNGNGETKVTLYCSELDYEIIGFNFHIPKLGDS